MDGQDVLAGGQAILELIKVKRQKLSCVCVGSDAGGSRVPAGRLGRVGAGDKCSIEIGHEAVVELHPECEAADGSGVGDIEGNAQVGGGIDVRHQVSNVGRELAGERAGAVNGGVEEAEVADDVGTRCDDEVNGIADGNSGEDRCLVGSDEVSGTERMGVALNAIVIEEEGNPGARRVFLSDVPVDMQRPGHLAHPAANHAMFVTLDAACGEDARTCFDLRDGVERRFAIKPLPRFAIPVVGGAVRS